MANQQPSDKANILIAGFGAIGQAMIKQAPHCHWISLNRGTNSIANAHISADILALDDAIDTHSPDFVVYTATPDSRTPGEYQRTYIEGLRRLLSWLSGSTVKHLFFVSSTSVYGQSQGEEVDELTPASGASFSGQAIAEGEALLAASDVPYSIVRFGGIYGPGREMLLRHVKQGVSVANNPAPLTNRIHEADCAGSLLHLIALAEQKKPLEPVYVAVDDDGANKAEVYQFIEQALNLSGKVKLLDEQPENLGKRCLNKRLKASGYQFIYPSFRQGYGELIGARQNQGDKDA